MYFLSLRSLFSRLIALLRYQNNTFADGAAYFYLRPTKHDIEDVYYVSDVLTDPLHFPDTQLCPDADLVKKPNLFLLAVFGRPVFVFV